MLRAIFSPIIRSSSLYLQYLVLFTQVAAGWCLGWTETEQCGLWGVSRLTTHIVRFQWCFGHGDSRAVYVVGPAGRPARPRTQHDYHHDTKVKPEAATVVIELLMMGGETTETCWAINKCQNNKLKNCGIRLVIYSNCTMMHGLTNLKFYI